MPKPTLRRVLLAVIVASAAPIPTLAAQSLLQKAKDKAAQHADQATTAAVDAADKAVVCAATDANCLAKAKQSGKPVKVVDSKGKPVSSADSAKAMGGVAAPAAATADASAAPVSNDPPGKGVWLNYDFVPGDRTIWSEDFSGDAVADFPRRWELVDGNLEVVEIKGHHYLRTEEGGTVRAILPEKLPARFTVEARYYAPADNSYLTFRTTDDDAAAQWWCATDAAGVDGGGGGPNSSASVNDVPEGSFVDCRFTIDSRYVKAYLNQHRTANNPTTHVVRTDTLLLHLPGWGETATLISDIRIAEGGKSLYDAIAASGRVSTHGILFDSGSDRVRGESTPTLKEIADMLKAHPDLKLLIEGHTDNVGQAAANLTLSDHRAAAVRQALVSTYGIDGARLTTKGLGDTKPIASNSTPEGRQSNRRVELVRQ
ncbi:MAG TPA: OmpA family protein [Gemmatimonadales bacterium]|nr:OmpA family protein [Gemmatimonadales bacterium]